MLRRGLSVSSPSDAAPSKPAKDRKPNTAAVATVSTEVPPGTEKTSAVKPWLPGSVPVASFTKITTTRKTISATEMPSRPSSDRVATRMSPYASQAMRAPATSAMTSHSAPFQIPEPVKKATPNRPTSAVEAAVNARYVPNSAQPEKKPARGPSVAPENAYTEPAWLKCPVSR